MTGTTLVAHAAVPDSSTRNRGNWVQSAPYDLAFFILAPVVTLPLLFAARLQWRPALWLAFVLGAAHYLSTFAFYFWDENQPRHHERWLAFFGGPVLIAATLVFLLAFRVPFVVQVALFFWNTYHVALQSCGIVSIYRHRAGIDDPRQKRFANAAIISTSGWVAFWNIETHPEAHAFLTRIAPELPRLLWLGLGALSILSLIRLSAALGRRASQGSGPGAPEALSLTAGLTLFCPYLFIRDSNAATFAMLLPHYLQYLGLVWLLHRRKFPSPVGSPAQLWLHRLSTDAVLLVSVLAFAGLLVGGARFVLVRVGQEDIFRAGFLLLAFSHFYLDGLFWAFKDPHVRRSIGPYLAARAPAEA